LPKDWAKRMRINGGDELDVEECEDGLSISIDEPTKGSNIEIDTDGLDVTTIKHFLRFSYRNGYDEIHVRYKPSQKATHFRFGKQRDIISVVNEEVQQLIGMDLVEQNATSTKIWCVVNENSSEFESAFHRIFYLMNEAINEFFMLLSSKDERYLTSLKEKHDAATRTISYLFRLLNKKRDFSNSRKVVYNTLLFYIESVFDILERISLVRINLSELNTNCFKKIIAKTSQYLNGFNNSFLVYKMTDATNLQRLRNISELEIEKCKKGLTSEEGRIVGYMESLINIARSMSGLRICLKTLEDASSVAFK